MAETTELKTPLYQRVGETLYKVLVETSADQVLMKDAENGDSNVQAEIESLRESVKNVLAANDAMIFKGVVNRQETSPPRTTTRAGPTRSASPGPTRDRNARWATLLCA